MERLTQKERMQLEEVFAMICTNRRSRVKSAYFDFCNKSIFNAKKIISKMRDRYLKN